MILIFSSNSDHSTNKVIEWIDKFDYKVVRINEDSELIIEYHDITSDEIIFTLNKKRFSSKEFSGYWYRRGGIKINSIELSDKFLKNKINKLFKIDQHTLHNYFFYFLEKKIHNKVGSFFYSDPNKLFQLSTAYSVGIKIPNTIVTSNIKYLDKNKRYITKSFNTVFEKLKNDDLLINYTNEINVKYNYFFTSLIQESIQKKYELRVFYLNEKCYSMAIFSQTNLQTSVDFRRYDKIKPNRNIPIEIPIYLKKKIIKFMNKMKLNCGSLDFIYDNNSKYVFLEVNPIGQFGMVSYPCNYNLEKKIAMVLCYGKC
ncbi:MAG: grasp-with-spasm system ATP-grasp peptide maturase [Sphingobacteriaceae bacterium]